MWEEAMAENEKDLKRVMQIYIKILENDPSNFVGALSELLINSLT
jgi:hypothetical protein